MKRCPERGCTREPLVPRRANGPPVIPRLLPVEIACGEIESHQPIVPGDTVAIVASFEPFEVETPELPEGLQLNVTTEQLDEILDTFFIDDDVLGDRTPSVTHVLAHKVVVTNVQEEERAQSFSDDEDGEAAGTTLAPTGNLLVTVALEAPQVERVVFSMEFGRIWLAAEPSNASEEDTEIIDRFNVFEDN